MCTEPGIGQEAAEQETAQQPQTDRRTRRLATLRVNSLGTYVMHVGQTILNVGVGLYSRVPAADQEHGLAAALGRAILCYLGNLFLVRPCPTAAGSGDND